MHWRRGAGDLTWAAGGVWKKGGLERCLATSKKVTVVMCWSMKFYWRSDLDNSVAAQPPTRWPKTLTLQRSVKLGDLNFWDHWFLSLSLYTYIYIYICHMLANFTIQGYFRQNWDFKYFGCLIFKNQTIKVDSENSTLVKEKGWMRTT